MIRVSIYLHNFIPSLPFLTSKWTKMNTEQNMLEGTESHFICLHEKCEIIYFACREMRIKFQQNSTDLHVSPDTHSLTNEIFAIDQPSIAATAAMVTKFEVLKAQENKVFFKWRFSVFCEHINKVN